MNKLTDSDYLHAVREKHRLFFIWLNCLKTKNTEELDPAYKEYELAKVRLEIIKANLNKSLGW